MLVSFIRPMFKTLTTSKSKSKQQLKALACLSQYVLHLPSTLVHRAKVLVEFYYITGLFSFFEHETL